PTPNSGEPEVTYANWVEPNDLADHPALAELITERRFLTRYDHEVDPDDVTADITFTRAPSDGTYRAVVTQTRYVSRGGPIAAVDRATGGTAGWIALGVVGVLVVAGVLVIGARRARGQC